MVAKVRLEVITLEALLYILPFLCVTELIVNSAFLFQVETIGMVKMVRNSCVIIFQQRQRR